MHAYMVGVRPKPRAYIGSRWWGLGALLWSAVAWAQPTQATREAASEAVYQQMEVLARALYDIESRALTRPSVEQLVQAAIRGMLRETDSSSRYFSAQELAAQENASEAGEVGLSFQEVAGSFVITSVQEGLAAQKAGLRRGDTLLAVDKQPTQGLLAAEVRSRLMGPAGSPLFLVIKRDGVWQPLRFRLQRTAMRHSPLETYWVDSVWVVRLSRFAPGVGAELAKQLPSVVRNKAASILLDLRGNLGGLLEEAVGIASLFLPPQTPVVRLQGPVEAYARLEKTAPVASGEATRIPLWVLMDKSSASVTEVLAAALKDHGRAYVLGERSHGKGSLQEKLLLPDGSAIHLTIARFVRVTGAPIDGRGVEPDCPMAQPGACKGLGNFPPKPPTPSKDVWLEVAISWLKAQGEG